MQHKFENLSLFCSPKERLNNHKDGKLLQNSTDARSYGETGKSVGARLVTTEKLRQKISKWPTTSTTACMHETIAATESSSKSANQGIELVLHKHFSNNKT